MKILSEKIHSETGFLVREYENDDGTTTEIIETNDGSEIELGEFERRLARYL